MSTAALVERIAAPLLILIGLTQLYATERWQAYYAWLAGLGRTGVRLNGLTSLAIGSLIVGLHNRWSGPSFLLALLGWFLLMEAAMCLLAPDAGLSGLAASDSESRRRVIVLTGMALIVIGGVLLATRFWGSG